MKKNNLADEEIFVQFLHELGESMVREKLDFEKTASTGDKKRKKNGNNAKNKLHPLA